MLGQLDVLSRNTFGLPAIMLALARLFQQVVHTVWDLRSTSQ